MAAAPPADALPRAAVERGCAALKAGDGPLAMKWLARARRLAPDDHAILFLLAAATGLVDAERALRLLDTLQLADASHLEAHVLRVTLLHREQYHAEAAEALGHLLGNLAVPDTGTFRALAAGVCRSAGEAGWVGLSIAGKLLGDIEDCMIEIGRKKYQADSPALRVACARAQVLRAGRQGRAILGSPVDLRSIRGSRRRTARHSAAVAGTADLPDWRAGRRTGAILLVTHGLGGGVERHVASRIQCIRAEGLRAIVLRPIGNATPGARLCDGAGHGELDFGPDRFGDMVALLQAENCRLVEYHHWVAHAHGMLDLPRLLDVPYRAMLHDYAPICPRVTLCGGAMRFCGEPSDVRDCDDCITDHGARMPFAGGVGAWRQSQAAFLAGAETVVAPSRDAALRLRRHMPMLDPVVEPWESDSALTRQALDGHAHDGKVHVALVGAIGQDKGFDVLLACVRDAARRALDLRFTVVGHTIDDARLMQAGPIFVSGRFKDGEAHSILEEDRADIGFLPSVWPETWCFALSALWQAGLPVVAFDLGAQAERIRRTGAGSLLPLGLPVPRINDTLVQAALASRSGMQGLRQIA